MIFQDEVWVEGPEELVHLGRSQYFLFDPDRKEGFDPKFGEWMCGAERIISRTLHDALGKDVAFMNIEPGTFGIYDMLVLLLNRDDERLYLDNPLLARVNCPNCQIFLGELVSKLDDNFIFKTVTGLWPSAWWRMFSGLCPGRKTMRPCARRRVFRRSHGKPKRYGNELYQKDEELFDAFNFVSSMSSFAKCEYNVWRSSRPRLSTDVLFKPLFYGPLGTGSLDLRPEESLDPDSLRGRLLSHVSFQMYFEDTVVEPNGTTGSASRNADPRKDRFDPSNLGPKIRFVGETSAPSFYRHQYPVDIRGRDGTGKTVCAGQGECPACDYEKYEAQR